MIRIDNLYGTIEVSQEYFRHLVGEAVSSCYGVVGMVSKSPVKGLRSLLGRGDQVAEIDIHHLYALSEDAYLCDVTYYVDTTGREGVVRTTTNARIVVIRSAGKLLVESMIGY